MHVTHPSQAGDLADLPAGSPLSFDAGLDRSELAEISAEVEANGIEVRLVLDASTIDLTSAIEYFSQIVELFVLDDTHNDLEAIGALRALETLHLKSLSKSSLATLPHLDLDLLVVDSPKASLTELLDRTKPRRLRLRSVKMSPEDVLDKDLQQLEILFGSIAQPTPTFASASSLRFVWLDQVQGLTGTLDFLGAAKAIGWLEVERCRSLSAIGDLLTLTSLEGAAFRHLSDKFDLHALSRAQQLHTLDLQDDRGFLGKDVIDVVRSCAAIDTLLVSARTNRKTRIVEEDLQFTSVRQTDIHDRRSSFLRTLDLQAP